MEIATRKSFVLTELSSFEKLADLHAAIRHGEFYQLIATGLVKSRQIERGSRTLGSYLVAMAEQSFAFRRMEAVEQVSRSLIDLPLGPVFKGAGRYYQALCAQRFGRGAPEQARRMLEKVAGGGAATYRLRAMQSLVGNSVYIRDQPSALSLFREATRFASREGLQDPFGVVVTQNDIAALMGLDGNHHGALALLENLLPVARTLRSVRPHVYCHYLNNLAVALGEAGRFDEAERACLVVLASPFASAYPEWRETYNDLELRRGCRASRSSVAVGKPAWAATNVVALPVRPRTEGVRPDIFTELRLEPARILTFRARKDKMVEESIDIAAIREQIKRMSMQDKLLRLFQLASSEGLTAEQIDEILETAEIVIRKGGGQG